MIGKIEKRFVKIRLRELGEAVEKAVKHVVHLPRPASYRNILFYLVRKAEQSNGIPVVQGDIT
ncbi:MAG: hypothetical protein ACKOAH_16695, partial [Pirellula sp.]